MLVSLYTRILYVYFLVFAQKLLLWNKLHNSKMTRSYCHLHSILRKAFEYQINLLLSLQFPIVCLWFYLSFHKFPLNETNASGGVAEEPFCNYLNRISAINWVYKCSLEWMHYGARNTIKFQYTQYTWVICSHDTDLQGLATCLCTILKY